MDGYFAIVEDMAFIVHLDGYGWRYFTFIFGGETTTRSGYYRSASGCKRAIRRRFRKMENVS